MGHLKFDTAKLEKLNDPGRFDTLPPDVFWKALDAPGGAGIIVEIGAGTGLFAAEFARRAPDATVYAVDTEDTMLEWMRAHRPEVAHGRVVPLKATETTVPLGDAVADIVAMINLHHELAEPAASYAEAHRILSPGGRLLVVDWAPADTPKGPPQAVRVSAQDIATMLESVGFRCVRIHEGVLPWHSLLTARKAPGDSRAL